MEFKTPEGLTHDKLEEDMDAAAYIAFGAKPLAKPKSKPLSSLMQQIVELLQDETDVCPAHVLADELKTSDVLVRQTIRLQKWKLTAHNLEIVVSNRGYKLRNLS